MQTHRHIAKRKTLFWQVGAVALLAAAGAALALPQITALFAPPDAKVRETIVPPQTRDTTDYSQLALDAALKGANGTGPVIAALPPPVEPVMGGVVEAPPPPPAATDWSYLGSIITPAKRSALVRVDGQQQIYSIGSTHADAKLVTIETEFIEVEMGGEKKKIALNERTLLAPTDPPKHHVTFRQPPGIGMGGPGAPMNFNTASRFAPNVPGSPPAATLDQARMAALAAAEAAARGRQAMEVPSMTPLEKLSPEEMEMASKYLSDPTIGDDSRFKYLMMLGIGRGASMDAAMTRLKESGIDFNSEAGKHIMQAVESNSRSKP